MGFLLFNRNSFNLLYSCVSQHSSRNPPVGHKSIVLHLLLSTELTVLLIGVKPLVLTEWSLTTLMVLLLRSQLAQCFCLLLTAPGELHYNIVSLAEGVFRHCFGTSGYQTKISRAFFERFCTKDHFCKV